MEYIPKDKLDKLNNLKEITENLVLEAENAKLKAQNSNLQTSLFIHQLYLEHGLSKNDKINDETGEILRAPATITDLVTDLEGPDTDPPEAPSSTKQLDLPFKEEK